MGLDGVYSFCDSCAGAVLPRQARGVVVKVARQVVGEDATIFPQVQRGLESSPHRGALGTREERLYMFQRYMAKSYGREVPDITSQRHDGPSPQ